MKHTAWLWMRILLLSALFVLIGLLPAVSVIPVSAVPPLAEMQFSEGTIAFRSLGGKSGSLVIKKSGGDKDVFSCREDAGRTLPCIHRRYEGGFGQIHWFWVKMPLVGSYKFPAQIVVNGEVLRDRPTTIEGLEETRIFWRFMFAPLTLIACLAGVFVMVVPKGTSVVE